MGILLVPERSTFSTVCALIYMAIGFVGWFFFVTMFIGIFFLLPTQAVAIAHSLVLASRYNKSLAAGRADLELRLSEAEKNAAKLGDLANF